MRRRIAVAVAVPIAVVGSLLAHQVGYLLRGGPRTTWLLGNTGHGYLRHAPLVVAACAVAAAVGAVLEAGRGRGRLAVTGWPLALVAPVAFAIQEHVERLLHDRAFPTHLLIDRSFLLGLALQVPFALLSLGVAAMLLRSARSVVEAIRRAPRPAPRRPGTVAVAPIMPARVRPTPLARRTASRAPPFSFA
ncbi:MAG TPA: hypothetical protein VIE12_02555 [Actinomycetota bacterium]|jgi:hypothetical protein